MVPKRAQKDSKQKSEKYTKNNLQIDQALRKILKILGIIGVRLEGLLDFRKEIRNKLQNKFQRAPKGAPK